MTRTQPGVYADARSPCSVCCSSAEGSLEAVAHADTELQAADRELLAAAVDLRRAPAVASDTADAPLLAKHVLHIGAQVDAGGRLADAVQRRRDGRGGFGDAEIADRILLDEEDRRTGERGDVEFLGEGS